MQVHKTRYLLLAIALLLLSVLLVTVIRASTLSPGVWVEWLVVILVFSVLLTALIVGGRYFSRRAQRIKIRSAAQAQLNPRQADVLALLAEGLSNRQIGERLFIAESTVKKHVSDLFVKLGAQRRTQAVKIARAAGLID